MNLDETLTTWKAAWPGALDAWSKFTRLQNPRWCMNAEDCTREGISGAFAMIRLTDQAVVIDLPGVIAAHVENHPLEVLAHEIGHHMLAPASLNEHARCLARMRWALPTIENQAGLVANLYTDLLINDRLQRSAGLSMAAVYTQLHDNARAAAAQSSDSAANQESGWWTLYMRMYEILWSLQRGTLTRAPLTDRIEGDAQLGARLIRAYARDWLDGSGRFAALCLPYLLDDKDRLKRTMGGMLDTQSAGVGGMPGGLIDIDGNEVAGAIHPSQDPELSGIDDPGGTPVRPGATAGKPAAGQAREPFAFGEILRSMGIKLSASDMAARYYKERAMPHLFKFPTRMLPESTDPLPEGLEPWDIGAPLEDADWFQSVLVSPRVVPGVTTVARSWGTSAGTLPGRNPINLDVYIDSSGSMPNPTVSTSYLTLAGAIIALSALRAGARVQATLWSGKNQFKVTDGFVRDEREIMAILCGFFGGATAFPIHLLRKTYLTYKPSAPPVHIVVISDDGVSTMFDKDEKDNSGWDIAQAALTKARGGGSLVLNLPVTTITTLDNAAVAAKNPFVAAMQRAKTMGWEISGVSTWPDLVSWARKFAARTYGD